MADHQRVHPANNDVETPQTPSAPLFPGGAVKSDQPPPPHHRLPKPKRRRSCLPRCLCWTILLLILVIVAVAASAGILYLVFRPKLPDYSVDGLRITELAAVGDNSLSAAFGVNITARDPNEKIGVYYEAGSRIGVWYGAAELTSGALPTFYQGHRNTTVLSLSLSGRSDDGTGLLAAVRDDLARLGYVPLVLRVRQPVRVRLGRLKLFKVKFLVRCSLAVDNLSPNNDIRIRSSSCKFRFKL